MSSPDDIEKLLREIDGSTSSSGAASGSGAVFPRPTPDVPVTKASAEDEALPPVLAATMAAGIAGGATWLVFAILPFLNGVQGGLGAFFAVWIAVFLMQRGKR